MEAMSISIEKTVWGYGMAVWNEILAHKNKDKINQTGKEISRKGDI